MSDNIQDPLDMDLSAVDTSFPVIQPGLYDCKVTETDVMTNEAGTIKVTLETIDSCSSSTGDRLEPGQKVFGNVNTKATGKAKPDMIARGLGEFVQSFGETTKGWKGRDLLTRHPELRGNIIRIRLDIQAAGPDKSGTFRKARNTVSEWIKK